MPKRGRGGRGGRGGKRGGGTPRERRPALLGAPRPRPPPRPQPLPPSEEQDAPAPVKARRPRTKPSAYDKLVAGLQRTAQPTKRAAETVDERPKKILASAEEEDEAPDQDDAASEEVASDAESDAESTGEVEGDQVVEDDADVNEADLAEAGVEQARKGDTYKEHYEHELTEGELRALEGGAKWEKTRDGPLGDVSASSRLPLAPAPGSTLAALGVKQRVAEQWARGPLSPEDLHLFRLLNSYCDLLYAKRTPANADRIRALYVLHAVNHIAKARDTVLSHNARLNALAPGAERPELRDQGFSRPRVLILVPFRQAALDVVQLMLQLAPKAQKKEVGYRKRFNTEYGPGSDDEADEADKDKPADHAALFKGNTDDCFRLGVGFSRSAVRLYTEFYGSDVIIASPLGLRLVIDSPEEDKRDWDFLSSIETVIVDQADVMLMQNWEHMDIVFSHLNLTPKKARPTTDFSRVRTWELNALGRHYRQTLIFSSFMAVEINAIFNRSCANYVGKVKITGEQAGVVGNVFKQVKQVFQRIDPPTLEALDDSRFQYFAEHVLPRMRAAAQAHTLVFVASYFEYVRVRNLFQKLADEAELTFCKLSEYTKAPDMARGRTFFADGRAQFMLYTERAHFYHRLRIRGIKSIVFYGLPHYPQFYTEMVNMLVGTDISCLVLYTRFEAFELERIVGEKRCDVMLRSPQNTHLIAAT